MWVGIAQITVLCLMNNKTLVKTLPENFKKNHISIILEFSKGKFGNIGYIDKYV